MAPKPRKPGHGGDGGSHPHGKPTQKHGNIDASQGITSAQQATFAAAQAGRPKEGGGSTPSKGDGRGTTEKSDANPYDGLPPEKQQEAKTELRNDSNKNFPLSDRNAEAALQSGPPGTTPDVAGPGGSGADVKFRDANGNVVGRTEIKSIDGGPNSFNRELSHAAKQVEYDGQVRIQVKEGTNVQDWMNKFQGSRTDEKLARYQNVEVVFSDPNGNVLGKYNAGTRLPRQP